MKVKGVCAFVCLLQFVSFHSCEKDYSSCGLQTGQGPTFIVGPVHDTANNPVGDWPWMASLGFYENGNWTHNCGATLIDDQHLLTAAHCLKDSENKLKVRLGVFNLTLPQKKDRPLPLDILNVSVHPKYDETAYFDVAIITIQKIELTKNIRPICLPDEPSDNPNQYQQYHMTVTGWGSASITGAASDSLKRAEVIGFSQAHCNRTHEAVSSILEYKTRIFENIPNYFQSQVLCAGNNVGKEGPCKGDSGGPLFYQDTDTQKFTQVGIIQGSVGECGEKIVPSIYVRLSDPKIFLFIQCTLSDTCTKEIQRVYIGIHNFNNASASCANINGRLPQPFTTQENVDLVNFVKSTKKTENIWLNAFKDNDQEFKWIGSNKPVDENSKWSEGEPNNAGGSENCIVATTYKPDGDWFDRDCNDHVGIICEIEEN